MAISVFCLAIGYCFSTLHPLFDNIRWFNFIDNNIISFIGTQNGFFFGFPYVALGALVVEYDFRRNDMVNVIGIIGSLILLMGESLFAVRYIGTNLTFLWLSALPLTYFTLQLAMTVNIPGDSRMFFLLRKSSTLIYVLHVLIMAIIAKFIISCDLEQVDSYHVIYFTATTVITTILAFLIVKLSTVSGFKFLRYFM